MVRTTMAEGARKVCQELTSSTENAKKNTHLVSLTGGLNHHRNDCLAAKFERENKITTNAGCAVAAA